MSKDITSFVGILGKQLKARGFDIDIDDHQILSYEVERAIKQINRCRRFTPTKDKLYDEKYEDLIIPLCISAFAKMGAEGQISHSENGILRTYTSGGDYPKELLAGIVPLIK